MKNKKRVLSIFLVLGLFLFSSPFKEAFSLERKVNVIRVDGVINPVIAEFITQSLEKSYQEGAEFLIIELDTPGGLDLSMRIIVKEMLNAKLPVVVYVSPSGARAASAGVMITLASDIAVMAPGTNIGAAHPVSLGGGKMDKTMLEKVVNDAAAYVESIARKRNRNADWAVKAVRKSVSITEKEALRLKVIDLIAPDLQSLLAQLDGWTVKIGRDTKVLNTKEVKINHLQMSFRQRVLNTISNPNIAYILLMIGLAGLYFELAHPGVIFPGVIGGISLILAFFALQTLPVNYAGILLILLAIIMFIAEIKVTSFGLLAIGGIISLTLGSLMLFEAPKNLPQLSWDVLIPTVLGVSLFFILIATLVIKAYRRKPSTGIEGLIGEIGIAKTTLSPEGKVFVHGEYWEAYSEEVIAEGEKVEVLGIDRMKLKVRKKGG